MTTRRMSLSRRKAASLFGGLALSLVAVGHAAAGEGQLRIAKQFGVVYLLLNVVEDQKLIEKHGKQAGLDIKVDYVQLSGGSAVNDALLSGNIEIAGAGVGPLFTLWDRTRGRQNVKGVASLGNFPYYLVTNNPDVKTIADFTEKGPYRGSRRRRLGSVAHPATGIGEALGRQGLRQTRQDQRRRPASRGHRRDHQGRHGNLGPFRQPALPGAGTGREPEGPDRPQFL